MSEITHIVNELRSIHKGDAWHGPALGALLAGLTPEQAAARPLPNAHSIWELVLHIAAWENVFRRQLEGQLINEPEEGDFPGVEEANEKNWAESLAKLDSEHEQLLAVIANLTDAKLEEPVLEKAYSVGFMLHGLVRHQVYHAGQIALLRKAVAGDN